MMKKAFWTRALRRSAALAVGLVVTVAVLELVVRSTDPFGISHFLNMERYVAELLEFRPRSDRVFVHAAEKHLALDGWDVRTNSHGLRGPERAIPKPPGVRRVLFVGDSVTFGWGVDDDETFVQLVEDGLNRREGATWEAINAGHLYHDSTQERAVLEEVGLLYEPDVVFLVYVGNDVFPTKQMRKPAVQREVSLSPEDLAEVESRRRTTARIARLKPYLPYTHRLTHFVYTRYRNYSFRQREGNEKRDANLLDRAGVDVELGLEQSRRAMLEMRDLSEAAGATFVVLDSGRIDELEAYCREQGLLFGRIAHADGETGVRNSLSDPHSNPQGHRQYAEKILRLMDELGLSAPRTAD